jgi:hypothetical protein
VRWKGVAKLGPKYQERVRGACHGRPLLGADIRSVRKGVVREEEIEIAGGRRAEREGQLYRNSGRAVLVYFKI